MKKGLYVRIKVEKQKEKLHRQKKARLRALENHLWLRCPTEPKERGVQQKRGHNIDLHGVSARLKK